MEFGGVMSGMEGLVCGSNSDNGSNGGGNGSFSSALISSSENTDSRRQKALSGFSVASATASLKQGRTDGGGVAEEQDWRSPKMARTETTLLPTEKGHFSLSSSFPKSTSNSHSLFPGGRHMLSFSSSKQDTLVLCSDGNLPSYSSHHQTVSSTSAASSIIHTGLGRNMHGLLAGFSGCFTPTQLMELEHQAMIYKFIDANVPVPPNLLISIKKSLNPAGCIGYSAGSLIPCTYGWGSFQLGFSGSSDPEPGRCRRTDGKKWRCSRDAVADQKYCERHMNRGRHRSRKPVEGHAGHANTMSISPSSTTDIAQTQIKNLQAGLTEPSLTQYNRMLMNKQITNNQDRDLQGLCMSISTGPSASDVPPYQKHSNPFVHSSDQMGFLSSSYMDSRNSANPPDLCNQETQPQLLHHLFGILPQNRSDNSTIAWPELEALNTERTQLSISIPMTSTCFSISSSPAQEKPTLSPLKSSQELDPTIHIGLGISGALDNVNHHRQGSWAPLSWGASTGGPLGEVLNNANSNLRDCPESNSSSPNLVGDWDSSPRIHSSPTGVLQKTALGSHSSSTGSSPRADNHRSQETTGNNPCDDRLVSSLAISTPIPSL